MTSPSVQGVRAAIQEAARRAESVRTAAVAAATAIKAERDAQGAQSVTPTTTS